MTRSKTYSISELAGEFDVTPRTIRFYEDKGIVSPERVGQRRVFCERDRVRLRLALRGKRIGLSLDECIEIIDMYNPIPGSEKEQLEYLLAKIGEHRERLLQKQEDIRATLASMEEIAALCRSHLDKGSSAKGAA